MGDLTIPATETASDRVIEDGPGPWTAWRTLPHPQRARVAGCAIFLLALTTVFGPWLARLFVHAVQSDLHSYIPLVPVIAGYLLYLRRRRLPALSTALAGTLMLAAIGAAALGGAIYWQDSLSVNDYLASITLAYVGFAVAGGFLLLGGRWLAAAAFPVAFLIFLVPLPDAAVYWLERGSVLASAEVSALFFRWTGTPLLRDGTFFAIPGIVLEVAQECSGIRSSWVLFITSLVAANLFLDSPWRRFVLVAFIFPLAIVRNAFRILVIGLLSVHIGPHMVDSVIHRRGGPIFFVLSLVPLFLLLAWLRRRDLSVRARASHPSVS